MRIKSILYLFVAVLSLLISACRPNHATPFDALSEWPGKLEGKSADDLNSVQVLAEEEVAGGLVILYSIPSKESGENVLVSTFVTPEGSGWRAQSSGWKDYSNSDDFVVAYIAGGNITDLTTVSGISNKGETVRIEWSDGQRDSVLIEDGAFVLSRPDTLSVQRIELLDSKGLVLESTEFGAATAEPTIQDQPSTETSGEMPAGTAVLDPLTQVPGEARTGIPQVDHVIDAILSNDLEARQALVRFVTAGCTTADGLGSAPRCAEGQAEGTPVEFLPLGGPGEGSSVLASEIARVLDFEPQSLYAAYLVAEDLPDNADYPRGTFVLIFSMSGGESVVLRVDEEGHIVRLDHLGQFPVDAYFQQKAADLIEPAPESEIFQSEAAEILVYPSEITNGDG